MSALGPQQFGLKRPTGEERRFREHQAAEQPRAGLGVRVRRLPNQTVINAKAKPASATPQHPFFVTAFMGGEGEDAGWMFRVKPGTVNGITPVLLDVPLNAPEAPTGPLGAGERHVYLAVTFTYTTTHAYVHTAVLATAYITVKTAEEESPFGPKATGSPFFIKLATFQDGRKLSQDTISSLSVHICDSGNADSTGNLGVSQA